MSLAVLSEKLLEAVRTSPNDAIDAQAQSKASEKFKVTDEALAIGNRQSFVGHLVGLSRGRVV